MTKKTTPNTNLEENTKSIEERFYEIPRLVMPGKYEPERDFRGVPLMFCRVMSKAEFEQAREQARQFGEEFLPGIYQAMAFCLSQKVAKKMFTQAAKAPSGRAPEVSDLEWLDIYKGYIASGLTHTEAMHDAVYEIRGKFKEADRVSIASTRKKLDRLIKREQRHLEHEKAINQQLKELCDDLNHRNGC